MCNFRIESKKENLRVPPSQASSHQWARREGYLSQYINHKYIHSHFLLHFNRLKCYFKSRFQVQKRVIFSSLVFVTKRSIKNNPATNPPSQQLSDKLHSTSPPEVNTQPASLPTSRHEPLQYISSSISNMASHVVVTDTSFRRQNIKVHPGTYMTDVLEEACKKFGLKSSNYVLKLVSKFLEIQTSIVKQ